MSLFAWWQRMSPIVLLVIFLSGCDTGQHELTSKRSAISTKDGPLGDADAEVSDNPSGFVKGFKDGFYLLMQQNCGDCHNSVEPAFAHPDSDTALEVTKGWSSQAPGFEGKSLVNFAEIPQSRLVSILSADNHYCWSDCSAHHPD